VQRQLGVPKTGLADVNGDGLVDLVMWFEVSALDLAPGDTVATMTAQLPGDRLGGRGSDRVRVVPPHLVAPAAPEDTMASGAPFRGIAIDAVRERGSAIQVAFRVSEPGDVSVDLLDVAGRRMVGIRPGWIAAGSHEAGLDPAVLSPGVYFVKLRQGDATATRRVVWMR
jgi:hypothetical protein